MVQTRNCESQSDNYFADKELVFIPGVSTACSSGN